MSEPEAAPTTVGTRYSARFNSAAALPRRLEMSTEFFVVVPAAGVVDTSSTPLLGGNTLVAVPPPRRILEPHDKRDYQHTGPRPPSSMFRAEGWVAPIVIISAVVMTLIAAFEVFVLIKAWRTTPSRRHLFLGQMLLLGLFCCAGLAMLLALRPTETTCALVRFGTGVAYALVFAALLVKCVFLISLNGGVYLPAPYQGLLLLFAILIQVAIGVQWLATFPPSVNFVPELSRIHSSAIDATHLASMITMCNTPYADLVLSLIYVVFLIMFVTVLAVKSRGIRENYREATFIGLSVGCSIPAWLGWILCGFLITERYKDACVAFGLVITSAIVFLIMFMPKGRQLAAMGKEGVYLEDREERFTSLSRTASEDGYAPSFFHFKSFKHSYGNSSARKHQPLNTIDLTIVAPPPPSYNRLFYHQFYPSPPGYYTSTARQLTGGIYMRPDDHNMYTTLEPTLSTNPNVYFQRGNGVHPGMMY